jgi:hypothetical protein
MMKLDGGRTIGALGLGVLLATLTGCQTWTYSSGMTLPSGRYLQHRPQYFPPSPDFPLERELAYMQQQEPVGAIPGAPAVAPAPAGGGGQ